MRVPIILLLTLVATATANCRCNSAIGIEAPPTELSNPAQQLLSIAITQLVDAPTIPHFLAMTTGAMFEAFQLATRSPQITSVSLDVSDISVSQAVVYSGYAALTKALLAAGLSHRIPVVNNALSEIGFGDPRLRDRVGRPIAEAVATRFPLNLPSVAYTPPNRPSTNADATCGTVQVPDGWQPLCLTPSSGGKCVPQAVPFLPFVNASLITSSGARQVRELISRVPPPYAFEEPLRDVARSRSAFADDYRAVIDTASRLDDRQKIIAEVFAPSGAIAVHRLALDEAAVRGLGLARSVQLFFALSAGVRDGFVGSSTVKVIYSSVRPITVLQCGFRGENRRVWRGPYLGVGRRLGSREALFKPYIQTPPFPGYVSGHTTIASAAATVFRSFFGERPRGGNCFIVERGDSVVEGRIDRGEQGFVDGVTNVPNTGKDSIGFSPRRRVTICWNSFQEYPKLSAQSRRFGGVHTPLDNIEGERLGRIAGLRALRFVRQRMRRAN